MIESKVVVFVLGLFIFVAYPGYTQAKIYRATACEGHHLKLSCYIGTVLKILDGGYGRRNASVCYLFDEPDPTFRPCQSPFAFDIIKSYCEGHRTCSLRAKNSNFQDPCPGQIKYAEAMYTCIPMNPPKENKLLQNTFD